MKNKKLWIFIGLVVLIMILNHMFGWSAYLGDPGSLDFLEQLIRENMAGAIGIYLAVTVIGSVVLALPGVTFAVLAGLLFGPALGTFLCVVAATAGAVLAFLAGRFFLRDSIRPAAMKNKYLKKWLFDETGKTLTLTSNHYYDGDLGTETYYYSKVSGLTAVEYTNASGKSITIAGVDDFAKIFDKTRTYILNYTDPGPDFVDRVAGKIYKASDGSYEYRFSGDGNTIQYYENGSFVRSYTFSSENKSAGKAEYKVGGAEYWGVRLADDKGKKDDTI